MQIQTPNILRMLAGVLFALMLTACGSTPVSDEASAPPTETDSQEQAAAEAAEAEVEARRQDRKSVV